MTYITKAFPETAMSIRTNERYQNQGKVMFESNTAKIENTLISEKL